MLAQYRTKTNIGVGIGIVLQILGRMLAKGGEGGVLIGLALGVAGLVFFIWGCMNYAEGKGHSKWLGLLGLLSCLGLIILAVLPDHHRDSK
jgi:hypothetical protein